jgi:hypothetical protein
VREFGREDRDMPRDWANRVAKVLEGALGLSLPRKAENKDPRKEFEYARYVSREGTTKVLYFSDPLK